MSRNDGLRIQQLKQARDAEKKVFDKRKNDVDAGGVSGMRKLATGFASSFDAQFKSDTVGLLSGEQFKQKRIDQEKKRKRELRRLEKIKNKSSKSKSKKARLHTLSFDSENHEDESVTSPKEVLQTTKTNDESSVVATTKRILKNPDVDTSFLPDRARDEAIAFERERLAKEWIAEQDRVKNEMLEITFSYWDGSGHRRVTRIKKGARIDQFLETVRRECSEEFSELRGLSVDNLMYIKEDLIIPQHHTFYELQLMKARGKSGPLFHFDVHDDVRIRADARIEKDESHAGKVLSRSWYDRNKHIFPASRWEVYDPKKKFDAYSIG